MNTTPSPLIPSSRRFWSTGTLLLILPFFLLACEPRDDRDQTVDDPYATEDFDDMPITSVSMLVDPIDPQRLDGRDVELFGVEIVQVLGDTAFYVTQGMRAGTPGATAPGASPQQRDTAPGAQQDTDAAPGTTPGQTAPGMTDTGMDDRVLVVREDRLGGIAGQTGDDDIIRVGARVDIWGEARTRDHMDRRADQPGTPTRQTQDAQQPGVQQPGARTMDGSVYVSADRIERHDPARTGTRTAPGTGPGAAPGDAGTGAQGTGAADRSY